MFIQNGNKFVSYSIAKSCQSFKNFSLCCPPRPPPGQCGGCPPQGPGGGKKITPPSTCRPGPIPPNPCVPIFPHKGGAKKYKYIFFFICLPIILIQAYNSLSHKPPHKDVCRDYEYMRLRTKRFPWGDGVKSLFHNDHYNFLPGECEPPPLDCD